MEQEHQKQHEIHYSTDIVINGKKYFQSLAHQLAMFLCRQYFAEYRFSAVYGFTSAEMYIENINFQGNVFSPPLFSDKRNVGLLFYDANKNLIVLRVNANSNSSYFYISYDIFKYLRDSDLVQIHTVEEVCGKKTAYYYTISKLKALRNGHVLYFKGHGTQFFIPVADFRKSDGKIVIEKKKKRTYKRKK